MLHVCVIKELLPVLIVYCHTANHTEPNRDILSSPLFLNQTVPGPSFFRGYSQMKVRLERVIQPSCFTLVTGAWARVTGGWLDTSSLCLPTQLGWASSQHGRLASSRVNIINIPGRSYGVLNNERLDSPLSATTFDEKEGYLTKAIPDSGKGNSTPSFQWRNSKELLAIFNLPHPEH